jgi:radical SAM protein with 4Fe4S-binding SPASM domain
MIQNVKKAITKPISKYNIGFNAINSLKKAMGKETNPNYFFPNSISIETASVCNLACSHCPPHSHDFKKDHLKYSFINIELFYKIMEEIDLHGEHRIALHKDGEPLLHPNIIDILSRVKQNRDHSIYLTTNAHRLDEKIGEVILKNKIDIINFSIGAASKDFYKKVRGNGFEKVQENILFFLKQIEHSAWKPRVIVQIINLPEFSEMRTEIKEFRKFWQNKNVEVVVYDKLSWGVLKSAPIHVKRYPCYSLWNSIFINSNGSVSPCCMDWQHKLIIGNAENQTIESIWQGDLLTNIRNYHITKKEGELPLCGSCNYWKTVPKLSNYMISK